MGIESDKARLSCATWAVLHCISAPCVPWYTMFLSCANVRSTVLARQLCRWLAILLGNLRVDVASLRSPRLALLCDPLCGPLLAQPVGNVPPPLTVTPKEKIDRPPGLPSRDTQYGVNKR
ncbi:hypothetical protein B0J13DRAFT_522604 [Dactylonectria estremocensis]|uniref:Uncharacterized protein n=1 Tax=Dactylonectria estremocensis TaxID=1079267 RepID=A0A9P9F3S1_9HYPO|nr:hypothetical protein B0J13DRAFT_522604 [Dactylonectria estremocensis]